MVLSNTNFRRKWLNGLVIAQKQWIQMKKATRRTFDYFRPFLAPRYWVIYLVAFALGFYLWGPAHGLKQLSSWQMKRLHQTDKPTVQTLQHELERLKKELKLQQQPQPRSAFNPDNFSRPALGQIIQGFEWVATDKSWRLHAGVDIGVPEGTSVMAAAEGVVTTVTKTGSGNYSITLSHGNEWESAYANLSSATVHEGEQVIKGLVIGTSGPAGTDFKQPAFRFGIYHEKQPLDPCKIVDGLAQQNATATETN
jgi:murein DD-endopeptidase MepM/ murein hydrolase activator NlpD